MKSIKIGIIREGKTPPDERVPLSPEQCRNVINNHSGINVVVQRSDVRRFKDEEYAKQGIKLVDSVDDCDILLGVKEVPISQLINDKTYFFFSHTIKKQPYNRKLLQAMLEKNIKMVDYECLTDGKGIRLLGFGKYAGVVGSYNSLYTYGKRTGHFDLKRAYQCEDRNEMEKELSKIHLPKSYKIVISGTGRVSEGCQELLNKIPIKRVDSKEFLTTTFDEPVYTVLGVQDYVKKKGEQDFDINAFFNNPVGYESDFMKFAEVANMYISAHYWDNRSPFIFNKKDAKSSDFNIEVVGDISCDIDGPVACTIRSSTIDDPIYGYDPILESESVYDKENSITVMAVDNLPCELPKNSSADFGKEFIDKVIPHLLNDLDEVISNATICENGKLTSKFEYLHDYVNGED